MKRIATIAAGCLLLAACFKSERLLVDLRAATHPMPEGEWTASAGSEDVFTLTRQGDHYLRVEGDSRYDVVVVPLAGHADTFIAAESGEGCTGHDAAPDCNWEYAIVVVGQDESWKQFAPDCKQGWPGMDQDVAVREDDGETCWFDDAGGLQRALAVAAERGSENQQLIHRPVVAPPEEADADSGPEPEPAKN